MILLIKNLSYTSLALFAFAGNSVLCRLALGDNAIDAASFTAIRLLFGCIVLAIILRVSSWSSVNQAAAEPSKGSWKASLMLFVYALTFSYAYISLETGIGALILFAAVQITMILSALFFGERLHRLEWLGVFVAFCGFVYLVLPTLGTPSLVGLLLMTLSGVAWGFYTLAGSGSKNPLSDTAYNFFRTIPLMVILVAITWQHSTVSTSGVILAALSGGLASGVGYTIWYMALKGISTTQAAVVQLLVPVIAGIGGVIFANEAFSPRLAIASSIILGGILAVVIGKKFSKGSDSIE